MKGRDQKSSPAELSSGLVLSSTRRYVTLWIPATQENTATTVRGQVSSKALDVLCGDVVFYEPRNGEYFIKSIAPRRNSLARVYRKSEKKIAANLDLLFIVTAPFPPFNPYFVDRVLTAASYEEIPCMIVVNKTDIDDTLIREFTKVYEELNLPVFYISAKMGTGMGNLRAILDSPKLQRIALSGISGVGKSTILNFFIPAAERRTQVVARGGQGQQTTTQALGFFMERSPDLAPLLLIDLPGTQSFGVGNLTNANITRSFPEIVKFQHTCKFKDCLHVLEEDCGVKDALRRGEFALFRYESYASMLAEIQQARRY